MTRQSGTETEHPNSPWDNLGEKHGNWHGNSSLELIGFEMASPIPLAPSAVFSAGNMQALEGAGFPSGLGLSPLLIIYRQTFLCIPPPAPGWLGEVIIPDSCTVFMPLPYLISPPFFTELLKI